MRIEAARGEKMDFFDVLSLIGGIGLFLFGMTFMGDSLKKLAGSQMKNILMKVTANPVKGFLAGVGVTMVIQSSTATNVMAISFVNAGMMSLKQSIPLVIGSNLGTTITAWIVSLSSIDGVNFFVKLLKPSSFICILVLIGVILYRFTKKDSNKDIGAILIGFSVLMYGMTTMSSSMSGLSSMPSFMSFFNLLSNPFLGLIFGIAMAALMQSSSASVGVLQALALAGGVTFETAIPIVLGINIGQVVPTALSSIGTSKDAKRVALVDFMLNFSGAVIILPLYMILRGMGMLPFVTALAAPVTIAMTHSCYKLICACWQLPLHNVFEKVSHVIIKDSKEQVSALLDVRFMSTPALALAQIRQKTGECLKDCNDIFAETISLIKEWDPEKAKHIHRVEEKVDWYQDEIDTYLLKLSTKPMTAKESHEMSILLHFIADCENITDHIYHMVVCISRLWEGGREFTESSMKAINSLSEMLAKTLTLSERMFYEDDTRVAFKIVAMEQRIVEGCEASRSNQLDLLRQGESITAGTAFTDILLDFERIADHLSKRARVKLMYSYKNDGPDAQRYMTAMMDQELDTEAKFKIKGLMN